MYWKKMKESKFITTKIYRLVSAVSRVLNSSTPALVWVCERDWWNEITTLYMHTMSYLALGLARETYSNEILVGNRLRKALSCSFKLKIMLFGQAARAPKSAQLFSWFMLCDSICGESLKSSLNVQERYNSIKCGNLWCSLTNYNAHKILHAGR